MHNYSVRRVDDARWPLEARDSPVKVSPLVSPPLARSARVLRASARSNTKVRDSVTLVGIRNGAGTPVTDV